ncbi:MmgE/PrpD family protein [Sphingobium sp. HBC34]|uniref:MmgE/PrpD family protein n=1 Tax=Sphingobium cyanobacteriorum TaxID=3063954 RepID=A0ABT8ZPB2_9SPHN|nr:MmgE/PrpD family protein [Sphingobium sp. HBC34]MDO7836374.1 MmgE/PrpD family protein [Sphingobium sp. HBC34]
MSVLAEVRAVEGRSARNPGLLLPLADFAHGLDLSRVPPIILEQARLSILDTIGCIAAGMAEADSRNILDSERRALRGPSARIFGQDERFPVEVAARVNAYFGDVSEHNDLVGSHASIATLPAAMAVADQCRSSGADLLRAYIAGTEIVTRLYTAYYAWKKPYMDVGIAPPGIINTIGAAAGNAMLMGLDHAGTLEAMAIGGGLAGWCPVGAVYDDGASVKPLLHGGWPAGIAVLSARYAAGGMTGPVAVLESPMGLFATLATHFEPASIIDPGVWHLANPRRKYHAACGYTHAGTDALVALHWSLGGQALADAREILIHVPFYTHRAVAKDQPPATSTEARFHLPYAAALAALGEDGVRPEHGRDVAQWLARDDLRAMLAKIRVVVDERFTHYEQCAVDVVMADGQSVHHEGKPPRGAPANPMTADMVIAKFRSNVSGLLSDAEADAYVAMITSIETLPDCDALYRPFDHVAAR